MKHLLISIACLFVLAAPGQAKPQYELPEDCLQLVVVVNKHWDDTTARMRRYQRSSAEAPWEPVGVSVPVNLGRTGLAWGRSPLMEQKSEKGDFASKKEGDGRSPAGLFPFKQAFGHPGPPNGYRATNLPFIPLHKQECVDDGKSEHYNTIVLPSEVGGRTWSSAETMKISVYQMGLVVAHNCPDPVPGAGSCIFFHIQSGPGKPTAGCTSMTRSRMAELMLWLERDKHPLVLQLPKSQFEDLPEGWPGAPSNLSR